MLFHTNFCCIPTKTSIQLSLQAVSCRNQEDVDSAVTHANDAIAANSSLIFVGVGPLVDLEMLNALQGFIIGTDVLDDVTAEKVRKLCALLQLSKFSTAGKDGGGAFSRTRAINIWNVGDETITETNRNLNDSFALNFLSAIFVSAYLYCFAA